MPEYPAPVSRVDPNWFLYPSLLWVDPYPAPAAFWLNISDGPNDDFDVDYQFYPPYFPLVNGVLSSVPNKFLWWSYKYFSLELTYATFLETPA
jgi:hypothetical protein